MSDCLFPFRSVLAQHIQCFHAIQCAPATEVQVPYSVVVVVFLRAILGKKKNQEMKTNKNKIK